MKKILFFSLISVFFINCGTLKAADTFQLGGANLAFKAASISFTDTVASNWGIDNGLYGGIEFYLALAPDGYLGIEAGYAFADDTIAGIKTELMFIPIEINFKGSVEATPNLIIDFGLGISSIYTDVEQTILGVSASADDTLIGGQIFFDMNYAFSKFFWGIHGKYQITSEFDDADYDFSNFRIGTQIGFRF